MTLEQIKHQELTRIQLEIDRTEDSLINWMQATLKDSIEETEENIKLTDEQLKKISNRLITNLIFSINGNCSLDHLNRQTKKLKTLYKDFNYLNS